MVLYDGRMECQQPLVLASNTYDELLSNGTLLVLPEAKSVNVFDVRNGFNAIKSMRGVKVHEAWAEP